MDMSKLIEALMSGAKSTFSDEQPVERLGMLPLAKYKDGGVFPAVPGAVVDLYNAMSSGMTADPSQFNSASPEQRAAYDQQNIGDAATVGGGTMAASMGAVRPAGSFGAGGGLKPLSQLLDELGGKVTKNDEMREGLKRVISQSEETKMSPTRKAELNREADDLIQALKMHMAQRRKDLGGIE